MDGDASTDCRRRVGVMGGSFDPVHLGHLLAAQDAFEGMTLDRVVFMPAARAPLRDRPPEAGAQVRLELLEAAISDDPRFEVSRIELDRGGESFTVDTARELIATEPGTRFFWIIGADQASRLDAWREIETLARMVEFIVLSRPGFDAAPTGLPESVRLHTVASHLFEISSSEIRRRIAAGRTVHYFLPRSVTQRIERNSLYR